MYFNPDVYMLDDRIKFVEDRQRAELERKQKDQRERRMRMLVATHARRLTQFEKDLAGDTPLQRQGSQDLEPGGAGAGFENPLATDA